MFDNRCVQCLARFYATLVRWSSQLQSLLLLYLRLIWGWQFILAGIDKVERIEAVIDLFAHHGIPYANLYAPMMARVEIIAGCLLLIGLASRFAAFPLILIMFTTLEAAHGNAISTLTFLKDPALFAQEPPFPYLMVSLLIFIFGPGRISLDAWIKRWYQTSQGYE